MAYNYRMSLTQRRNPRLVFRLAAIRAERGLTLKELSQKCGFSEGALSDQERGRHAMPSDTMLIALVDALCVKPGDLFEVKNKL